MNEPKIIQLVQSGKVEKAFQKLYRFYPKTEKHICLNSGSKEEALDIFQEALIILYRKITESSGPAFSLEGFLVNTCKLLWSNELRKKKVRLGDETGLGQLVAEEGLAAQMEKEDKLRTIEKALRKIGEKCRNMLEAFYFRSLPMETIARKWGYKTVDSAKVQKYKCLESLRKMALAAVETDSVERKNEGI